MAFVVAALSDHVAGAALPQERLSQSAAALCDGQQGAGWRRAEPGRRHRAHLAAHAPRPPAARRHREENGGTYTSHTRALSLFMAALGTFGSDHFPVILKAVHPTQEDKLSRFVYDKADWDEFSRLCENLVVDNYANLADPISKFTKDVVDIMEKTIPKTSVGFTSKPRKPWFNAACKQAINERRKALDQLKRHPDLQHVVQYKRKYAIARKIIKASKTASW